MVNILLYLVLILMIALYVYLIMRRYQFEYELLKIVDKDIKELKEITKYLERTYKMSSLLVEQWGKV